MATKRISRLGQSLRCLNAPATRPILPITIYSPPTQRTIFTLPTLAAIPTAREDGIRLQQGQARKPKILYSPEAFRIAWHEWHVWLLNRLNYISAADPEIQTMYPQEIARRYQRDPSNATLFNFASLAHNNHTYFSGISAHPRPLSHYPELKAQLKKDFESIPTLRNEMAYMGKTMFGSGFVWLVWVKPTPGKGDGGWKLLSTYNAGTPYLFHQKTDDGQWARGRLQGLDMSNMTTEQALAYQRSVRGGGASGQSTAGAFGQHSARGREDAKRTLGAPTEVYPCLCVNLWPQVWMADFGADGKENFLETWWDFVDWGVVNDLAPAEAKRSLKSGHV